MTDLATLLIGLVLANYFLLVPQLAPGGPKEATAWPAALATALALLPAAVLCWGAGKLLLAPLGLPDLASLVAVGAACLLAPVATHLVQRLPGPGTVSPSAMRALSGVNTSLLAVALLAMDRLGTLAASLAWSLLAGTGFLAVTVLFAGLRERLEAEEIPAALRGPAIALVTAGFFALALGGVGTLIRG
ncbi:MAG: Rnf-Nqr domain containing protein [Gammaproteobacteria bacterium]|nr:MAG: Rnf-Nqr domain containing protein [Gammaproteobacteria bacterium]